KIQFSAQDASGTPLSGIAEGFLARILQHEIDHLNGILFIDLALPESLVSIEEYRERRRRALNQE
ncbi:peptide deformylase, partial [Acinetobacter baumannii]